MRERLLGYLFGQLDADEQREVERALASDARLRRELACLRACVAADGPPREETNDPPPEGLAERTCQHVSVTTWTAGSLAPASSAIGKRWRITDAAVAIGVALAIATLLLPAMQQSRHVARLNTCQNNLRQLGQGVLLYAASHNGRIPQVPTHGKDAAGGIFAVKLADSGLLDRDELSSLLVCPASRLADSLRAQGIVVRVPPLRELLSAEGERLNLLRRLMGGSYAYRIGYVDRGRYCVVRIRRSGRMPLMADAPSLHLVDFQSSNHGGAGQNVLYDDGRVVYLTHCTSANCNDKLFVNDAGYRAPGTAPNDAVLFPSDVGPDIDFVSDGH